MSMTVAEARSEIATLFKKADEIEKKYPSGDIDNNEDREEVKRLLTEIDGLETKLASLEEVEQRRERIRTGVGQYAAPARDGQMQHAEAPENKGRALALTTPSATFMASPEYKRLRDGGYLTSNRTPVEFTVPLADGISLMNLKALLRAGSDSSGGAFVMEDRRPGYLDILQQELNAVDLIPRYQTRSDTIEYIREDTFTNNAAVVAEATATTGTTGLKPESELAFSAQTEPVKTVAHWVPVTNRMLADYPQMRGIIDNRLLVGLDQRLSAQVLTGDGNGENFTGILTHADVLVQGKGTDSAIDALFKGRTQIRVTGHARPTGIVLHPNDWQDIRLARENAATGTLGGYLLGPPSMLGATTLWGLPVVEDEGITENTGLVGDFQIGAGLFDREQSQIRVGLINDQFVRNMQTILAELRAALVVFRPTAFAKVTGI